MGAVKIKDTIDFDVFLNIDEVIVKTKTRFSRSKSLIKSMNFYKF